MNVLSLPMRSTRVSLDSDRPLTGVYHVTYHIHDALAAPTVRTLPDGRKTADFSQVVGRLAESFEPSEDFSRWTVRLRRGVMSHAGNELTAADVVWSYDRIASFRAIGYWRAFVLAGIRPGGVRAADRSTVEFNLDGYNPVFPRFLCYGTAAIVDSIEAQRHATADDPWAGDYLRYTPCGFGGWDVREQTDELLHLVPRPDFWAGPPPVDGVIYRSAPTREQGLDLYERGVVNAAVGLYPDEARRLAARPDTTLTLGRTNHATIEFDTSRPPFDRREVREAVLRTIPYDRIRDEAYLGFAEAQRGIYQPNTPEYSAYWPYPPDADLSRRLVGDAGGPVVFAIPASAESDRIGSLVREALATIGLDVTVTHIEDLTDPPHLHLRDDCSHGIADPHYDLAIDFAPPRDMPFRIFAPRRLGSRLREIRQTPAADQPALYAATQREILDDALIAPIAGHSYVIAHRSDLDPWFFSPAYLPLNSLFWSAARYVLPPAR